MARRFEFVDGASSKFWEVDVEGDSLTVRFGRIGTNGQTQTKTFASPAKSAAERDKLVREKTGKGYTEVGGVTLAPVTPAARPQPTPDAEAKAAEAAAPAAPRPEDEATATAPAPRAEAKQASPADVPEALARPRWVTHPRKEQPSEVLIPAPPFSDEMSWPDEMKAAWIAADYVAAHLGPHPRESVRGAAEACLQTLDLPTSLLDAPREAVAKAIQSMPDPRYVCFGRFGALTFLPDDLAVIFLDNVRTAALGDALDGLKAAAAKLELRALPGLTRHAATSSVLLELLTPYASAGAAPVIARAFTELKKHRGVAEHWLRAHPDAAIAGLLAPAIGKVGKERAHAENALRFVAANGRRDAIASAARDAGPSALAATLAVLDADPLDLHPAKMPALPAWIADEQIRAPELRARPGAVGRDVVENLALMLAISKLDDPYAGLAIARDAFTKDSLARFAWSLFATWLRQERGFHRHGERAHGQDVWALLGLGHFGDDACARDLVPYIRDWPARAFARAVAGLDVLAAIGTDFAVARLNGIALKEKSKGLQERAREKIAQVAAARGFTPQELADRLVPDLGLGADGTLTLDFGPRRFKVTFDEALKPVVLDDADKRLPDLPKPKQTDDAEAANNATARFKLLKADARALASQQIARFDLAMCERRRWDAATFRTLLAAHPVARHLVKRLAWATYADGKLSRVFRVAEDGTFADANDEAFTLAEDATIGVAHALEIDERQAAAIAQVFADYEILQPFKQLGRDVHVLSDAEKLDWRLVRWARRPVPTGRVLGLDSRGWRRGPTGNYDFFSEMLKRLPNGFEARLLIAPGVNPGNPRESPEQTIEEVGLYVGVGTRAAIASFGELHPIVASEIIRDVVALTG